MLSRITSYNVCYTNLLRDPKEKVDLDDEVSLQYYRVQMIFEGSICLEQGDPLANDKYTGKGKKEDEKSPLSDRITSYNVCYTKLLRVSMLKYRPV